MKDWENMKCETCQFRLVVTDGKLYCRYLPPTVVMHRVELINAVQYIATSQFPPVGVVPCGQWQEGTGIDKSVAKETEQ